MRKYTYAESVTDASYPLGVSLSVITSDFEPHTHEFQELVLIFGGSSTHLLGQKQYHIQEGELFVVGSNTSHAFQDVRDLEICNIMFDQNILLFPDYELKKMPGFQALFVLEPYLKADQEYKSRFVLNALQMDYVKQQVLVLIEELDQKDYGWKGVVKAHFISLIAYLARQYDINMGNQKHNEDEKLYFFAQSIAYVERNYVNPISLAQLAEIAYVSPRHYIRVFKKALNNTPAQYILSLRMNDAAELIAQTDLSICRIGELCGIPDCCYFSKAFKKHFGKSPNQYRHIPRTK